MYTADDASMIFYISDSGRRILSLSKFEVEILTISE